MNESPDASDSAMPETGAVLRFSEIPEVSEDDLSPEEIEETRRELEELAHRTRMMEARLPLPKVEADLASVLDDVASYIRKFVVFKDDRYADVLALWVAHTHAFEASESTPYIWVTSPEMGSGKTRLLEVLEVLVRRPWRVVEPSEAVTFRMIHSNCPTLLLDEIDVIFSRDRRGDTQSGLRGIMNGGYRRGAFVPRASDFGRKLENFSTYCPKAFAGIGKNLPDTVVDRSIKVPLKRKRTDEKVDRFSHRKQQLDTEELRNRLRDSTTQAEEYLREWREWIPEEMLLSSDRHAEVWEPLFAIAEAAGHEWPVRARELAHWTCEEREKDIPASILLLQHIREAFAEGEQFIPTLTLLDRLASRDDGPWGKWWQYPQSHSDVIDLAKRLREFDVEPVQTRLNGERQRGYRVRDFEDAWERYLPRETESGRVGPGSSDSVDSASMGNIPLKREKGEAEPGTARSIQTTESTESTGSWLSRYPES